MRAGYSAENFSILRRIALNLLKQEKTSKRGIKGKRHKAGWDNDYLFTVLMS
ncbi:MAG: ISAs1 family transposase, partial [Pseudobdellovibrionaceae bacterium]|nr:ISAs1 family transposase [Pseudobdellovibrionaceae bacterium]